MEYRIGDIADILNVSTEMIRYYEKMGVINPHRNADNNYRVYTAMDVFALLEAIQLKELDVNIKQINNLKTKDYTKTFVKYLDEYKAKVINDIKYKKVLLDRIDILDQRYRTISMNCGNYWIKNIGSYYKYFMLTSKNDDYHEIEAPKEVFNYLYSNEVTVFVDSIIEFNDELDKWYLIIDQNDAAYLKAPEWTQETVESSICLCTIIDMGDIGQFSGASTLPLTEYAKQNHYEQTGNIYGLLCARGIDNGKFHRYMELRMPIKEI